jgi:hypothetical protein
VRRPLDFDGLLKLTTVHPKNKLHQTNPTNQFFKFFFISSPFFLKSETYSSNKIKNQTKKKNLPSYDAAAETQNSIL